MKTATRIKDNLVDFRGHAALYRLDPLLAGEHEYVIVSAVDNSELQAFTSRDLGDMRETYIFPATSGGDVTEWAELDGSMGGTLNHAVALLNAGYEVVR